LKSFLASILFLSGLAQAQHRVVATTTFLADMARQIAGPHQPVGSLLPAGTDPHIYEPVPATSRQIVAAELILVNGLTLEGWLQKLIDQSGTQARVVIVSEGVAANRSADYAGASDPHAWMDPRNAIRYCQNIRDALSSWDPAHAAAYARNYEAYAQQLRELDQWIETQIGQIPRHRRVLITSHDAFRYYARRYGLAVYPLMGTTTEAEVQAADMRALSRLIAERDVTAVFPESTINPKLLEQLARERHIQVGDKLYGDSLSEPGGPADSYLSMLRHNTTAVVNGLTARDSGKQTPAAGVDAPITPWLPAVAGSMLAMGLLLAWRLRLGKQLLLPSTYELSIQGLTVSYVGKTAIRNVHLQLAPGKVYGLVGANGSGKSTLIKAMLGLIKPDAGQVRLAGQPISSFQRQIAYIPQKEDIDWQYPANVQDVVRMGRYPHLNPLQRMRGADHSRVQAALAQVELGALAHRQINEISGGQQQRTFIARALCQDAAVYLLDEPFVGVDAATEQKMLELLRQLARQGKLILIVHHDLAKAATYFDELVLFNQRVVAQGTAADMLTTENLLHTFGGSGISAPIIQEE
jgi:ABC-type Mn2+/Zn2+ transport system ATPase subunit/ABC-type Zn uptake system ZnuABC Zn-binding protein ZnuA